MNTSSSTSRFPTTARSTSSRIRSVSEATRSSSAMAINAPPWKSVDAPTREKRAGQGRRERSYSTNTDATEDAARRSFAAVGARCDFQGGAYLHPLNPLEDLPKLRDLGTTRVAGVRVWPAGPEEPPDVVPEELARPFGLLIELDSAPRPELVPSDVPHQRPDPHLPVEPAARRQHDVALDPDELWKTRLRELLRLWRDGLAAAVRRGHAREHEQEGGAEEEEVHVERQRPVPRQEHEADDERNEPGRG